MAITTIRIPGLSEPWGTHGFLPGTGPRQELAFLRAGKLLPVYFVFLFERSAVSGAVLVPILSPFPGISVHDYVW